MTSQVEITALTKLIVNIHFICTTCHVDIPLTYMIYVVFVFSWYTLYRLIPIY